MFFLTFYREPGKQGNVFVKDETPLQIPGFAAE